MNTTIPVQSPGPYSWLAPLASTLGILSFFFFIDEGYYDFRWMTHGGNWIVFFIYFIILFPVQSGISTLLFKRITGIIKLAWMVLLIMPLSIGLFLGITYLIAS